MTATGNKPRKRARPDWRTYGGYAGIVAVWFPVSYAVLAAATGDMHVLIWLLVWTALVTAAVKFTKWDRRRRTITPLERKSYVH